MTTVVDEPSVELLAAGNPPVVHVHPRRFPAVAIQGDTLYTWFDEVDQAVRGAASVADLADLRDRLGEVVAKYEAVLAERGFAVPYVRRL